MTKLDERLRRRVLYVLHRGWVEARLLAMAARHEQLADLADALEVVPGYLNDWNADSLESIKFNLRTYQGKYEHNQPFDYLSALEADEPPERF